MLIYVLHSWGVCNNNAYHIVYCYGEDNNIILYIVMEKTIISYCILLWRRQ